MATYEVSTWTDLVAAAAMSGSTIKLTADIDCNDYIPEGLRTPVAFTNTYFDGQGHTIRNLRTPVTGSLGYVFGLDSGSTMANTDFVNIVKDIINCRFIQNSGYNGYPTVTNCRFVGRRNGMLFGSQGGDRGYTTFNRCFINVPSYGDTNALYYGFSDSARFNFCWIRETYTGFVNSSLRSGPYMNGCYCDGTVVLPTDSSTVQVWGAASAGQIQNVFDYDFRTLSDSSSITYNLHFANSLVRNQIRNYDDPSIIYTPTITCAGNEILATPAEMIDPQALYNKGFDIIVP